MINGNGKSGKKFFGFGYTFKVVQLAGEGETLFTWEVGTMGKQIAIGRARSEEEAEKMIQKTMGEHSFKRAQTSANKQKMRLKLRSYLERRPYLVCAVAELLMPPTCANNERIWNEVKAGEEHWFKFDKSTHKTQLPTHHLAKQPEVAGTEIADILRGMYVYKNEETGKLNYKRLMEFAVNTFGPVVFSGLATKEETAFFENFK